MILSNLLQLFVFILSGDDMNHGNHMNNNHNHYNNNHHHHHHPHHHHHQGAHSNSNNNNNNTGALITNASGVSATKPAVLAKPTDRFLLPTKRKGLNWIGLNLDHHKRNESDEKPIGKGSFKMTKPKHPTAEWQTTIDANRTKTDAYNDASAAATTPTAYGGSRNDSVHFPFTNGDRKASAPNATSYLSKLTFSAPKTAKEKRLLGSPRLHRAASSIFGRKNVESPTIDHHHQNFTQFDSFTPKYNANNDYGSSMNASGSNCSTDTIASRNDTFTEIGGSGGIATPNFMPSLSPSLGNTSDQNIEYPPVFVPETYSLRDPNVTPH